jgi:anaerobic nitric oxide reductase transcription regulator
LSITLADMGDLASSLTRSLASSDRYRALLTAVERVVACDAIALLRLEEGVLVPVAWTGLVPEVAGRRLHPRDHPRLAAILASAEGSAKPSPVRFAPDSALPDPWDGLIAIDPHACAHIHACMGCALVVDGKAIGLLSVDAFDPKAFDAVEDETFATFAAMAAAAMQVAGLIEALEHATQRQGGVLRQLAEANRGDSARLLGSGAVMRQLHRDIDQVASSDLAVLITGETGVGKELVAKAIHAASSRSHEPMVSLNCAALPEHLVESQLFGHLRGSFTGATEDRAGVFEIADGGTLFLDEVGELPLAIQAKLLRALQIGEIQRIGSNHPRHVDVRVVAATNRDLAEEQHAGRFRADLFYRLAVFPITVPPLRERSEDIPLIAGHILEREARRLGRSGIRLSESGRAALVAYAWPGNVRELEHVLMRAAVRANHGQHSGTAVVLQDDHLGLSADKKLSALTSIDTDTSGLPGRRLREQQDAFTRRVLQSTLARHRENWSAAARELGLTPSNTLRLARRLGLRDG